MGSVGFGASMAGLYAAIRFVQVSTVWALMAYVHVNRQVNKETLTKLYSEPTCFHSEHL